MKPAHFRLVGIGAGPANLSLAALLHGDPALPNLFFDSKPSFTWHDDQLIAGATLQVSIFKDLVSLSDPTNRFSFMSYLHEHGRMYHFLNAQFAEVPRNEFRNYLAWAAQTNENVIFSETVKEVDFDGDVFRISTDRQSVTADNIAVGVGTVPWVPDFAVPHLRSGHFHVSQFLSHAGDLVKKQVAVVGGGQSGAEAFLDLISRPSGERPASVSWISSRRNFFPIDDSTFTNDFYMPGYAEYFYRLSEDKRAELNSAHVLSSDGISESTLRAIYQQLYRLRFIERDDDFRFGLLPNRTVVAADSVGDCALTLRHKDESGPSECLPVDAVVWATGFRPASKKFLEPLMDRVDTVNGEVRVNEDYAVSWGGPADRNIFMQNAVRGQRGLPDVNLSLNAWRAQRIAGLLRGHPAPEPAMSFIDWSATTTEVTPWVR